ncbi:MAG: RNA polymerase sigma factor [Patescibacteria group bacterium]
MSLLSSKENLNEEYDSLSDEELLSISISSPDLFSILVDRHQKQFLKKAVSIIRDGGEAEDIVQETFTKIYLKASKFQKQEGASFKSWGYKILINTSFTYYKKKQKRKGDVSIDETILNAQEYANLSETIAEKELLDYVARIMTKLPKALSKVLHLYEIEGMRQKEIADMENIKEGAVKTRIYRAKKEFQKISDFNLV